MKVTKAKVTAPIPRLRRRTVRLTEYEESRLKDQAAIAGLSMSAYMRRLFASSSPVISQTDQLMIRELRRMGGLLKSNFETLRNAGAGRDLVEYQEEILRKMGQAIDRLAAWSHDR